MIPNMTSDHWGEGDSFIPVSTDASESLIQLALPVQPNTQIHHIYLHIKHPLPPAPYIPQDSILSSYGSEDAYRHETIIRHRPSANPTPPYTTDEDSNAADLIITTDDHSREQSRACSPSLYQEQPDPVTNGHKCPDDENQARVKDEGRSRTASPCSEVNEEDDRDKSRYRSNTTIQPEQSPRRGRSTSLRRLDGYESEPERHPDAPHRVTRSGHYERRISSASPTPSIQTDGFYEVQDSTRQTNISRPAKPQKVLELYPPRVQSDYPSQSKPLKIPTSKLRKCPLAHQDGTKHSPNRPHPGYTPEEYENLCYAFKNGYDYSRLIKGGSRVAQPPRPPPPSAHVPNVRVHGKRPAHEMEIYETPEMVSYKRRRLEPSRYTAAGDNESDIYVQTVPVAQMPPAGYPTARTMARPRQSYYVNSYAQPAPAKRARAPTQHYTYRA